MIIFGFRYDRSECVLFWREDMREHWGYQYWTQGTLGMDGIE